MIINELNHLFSDLHVLSMVSMIDIKFSGCHVQGLSSSISSVRAGILCTVVPHDSVGMA
jgi:hypothetical protein